VVSENPAMLVINRKKNESIVIDNGITVTVVDIPKNKVKLQVVCPKGYAIQHAEDLQMISDN
jgi:carbon storage regulator CsrA